MDTWSPLFSSIVASSVWGKEPHIKVVWVTMLALKDKNGFVGGSVSGLARFSVVTEKQCQEALDDFLAPDKGSRNDDYGGRKIRAVEGGWEIIGHARFQKLMQEVTKKVGSAKRQAKHREKVKAEKAIYDNKPNLGEAGYVKIENEFGRDEAERILDGQ